jgi:hypothetical protein
MAAQKPVVCFLGPETSYTHQAALQTFPADKFELLPVLTIKGTYLSHIALGDLTCSRPLSFFCSCSSNEAPVNAKQISFHLRRL